ncbi:nickel pincer cofactor biosynthesis protein LarC [Pelagicoccus sp. SDUM812002]|uniref:nickel pincer cofactor biosynthesis protein LarC n=1 Tax=Pelagicoccus sp. SDUM812002 TaxID=3041266 RepID=UPI0028104F15|nr:nickel pincer cofactor biosynthesis protein LarC [Pelagicoccus sp. SDUM812002]MDQ8187943.1 nickel pincer cofactor biosynthesis protein LarC [Pelagicoccus sp. SDUM812002]
MSNTLYLEPFSGIAGDMLLSALCSLADAYDEVVELPAKLHLPDGRVEIQTLNKNGIVCRHINIIDTGEAHSETHSHSHDHGGHAHSHDHSPHRHLSDILALIEAGHISQRAKEIAKSIFLIIGESEARIHNIPIEKIHFHEVSGVDSILDIVGCAVLIDRLDISKCYSDPVCLGFGTVKTEHGLLPVPAPATADILKGIPTYKGDEQGERCTPTGAAILKYLQPEFTPPPTPTQEIAYGPGKKDFRAANVIRTSLLAPAKTEATEVWVVETNLDDFSGEYLGTDFQDGLIEAGALDFHLSAVQMKKGRPAILLSALSTSESRDAVADYILENSSSIGVRFHKAQRRTLARRKVAIETDYGTVLAKESEMPSGKKKTKLEYESLKELAQKNHISLQELKRNIARS